MSRGESAATSSNRTACCEPLRRRMTLYQPTNHERMRCWEGEAPAEPVPGIRFKARRGPHPPENAVGTVLVKVHAL